MRLPSENTCTERKVRLKEWPSNGLLVPVQPDLHGVVFTLLAVLEVQVDQSDGDDVAFPSTSAPVQSGVRQVSVGISRRLHPSQQRGRGQVAGQEKQETALEVHSESEQEGDETLENNQFEG